MKRIYHKPYVPLEIEITEVEDIVTASTNSNYTSDENEDFNW